MIKRNRDELTQICIENNFGGSGKMYLTQFMGGDYALPQLKGLDFPEDFESSLHFLHELILEPGATIGAHTHHGSEEIYFMVEGAGEITVDGETAPMRPGDAVLTRSNSTHSFIVTGDNPVKLFIVEAGVEE